MELATGVGFLIYAAFVLHLLGFLARDELYLRLLMFGGTALYVVYYFYVTDAPLWDAVLTNSLLGAANVFMIGVVVLERTTFAMSPEVSLLYSRFAFLSPGQFRRLHKHARAIDADGALPLTLQGERLEQLHFISEGSVEIEKAGQKILIDAPLFVGEIAFIMREPASATVRVQPGARGLTWDHRTLDALFRRAPSIGVALSAHMNSDLARKVARSQPAARVV